MDRYAPVGQADGWMLQHRRHTGRNTSMRGQQCTATLLKHRREIHVSGIVRNRDDTRLARKYNRCKQNSQNIHIAITAPSLILRIVSPQTISFPQKAISPQLLHTHRGVMETRNTICAVSEELNSCLSISVTQSLTSVRGTWEYGPGFPPPSLNSTYSETCLRRPPLKGPYKCGPRAQVVSLSTGSFDWKQSPWSYF